VNYWLVRGSPAENGDFSFMKAGKSDQWRTKRPPRNWQPGDRLLFWATAPRLELIALGEFHGESGQRTPEGETLYNVRYLTAVVSRPLRLAELRTDASLQDALFLKKGPASSAVRLSNSEGEHLYRLLVSHNKSVEGIWPELETREAAVPDIDDSAIEGERRLVQHVRLERSRSLVEAKRKSILAATGRLACEVCGFEFGVRYGSLGEGFCEVHPRKPLAAADAPQVTYPEDLAIVCSNCHRILHRTACTLSVEELRERLTNG
jgi:hypothetical protein